jgi:hypothetical protein
VLVNLPQVERLVPGDVDTARRARRFNHALAIRPAGLAMPAPDADIAKVESLIAKPARRRSHKPQRVYRRPRGSGRNDLATMAIAKGIIGLAKRANATPCMARSSWGGLL